jgi:hypothetical protein
MAPAKKAAPKKRKTASPKGNSSNSRRKSRANVENEPPIRATRSKKQKSLQPVVEEDAYDDDATVIPNAQQPFEVDVEVPSNPRARANSQGANDDDDEDGVDDPEAIVDSEDSDDDDDDGDGSVIGGKPPGMSNEAYIRTLQRQNHELQQVQQGQGIAPRRRGIAPQRIGIAPQQREIANQQSAIARQQRDIATVTANRQVENVEMLKKIKECVTTKMWHTCKFITNNSIHEKATIFVLTNFIGSDAHGWSAEYLADMVLTYKKKVGQFLNERRNYVQSQIREVVLALCLHRIDAQGRRITGEDRIRDPQQPADTPPNQISMVMAKPFAMFRVGLIEKAITR